MCVCDGAKPRKVCVLWYLASGRGGVHSDSTAHLVTRSRGASAARRAAGRPPRAVDAAGSTALAAGGVGSGGVEPGALGLVLRAPASAPSTPLTPPPLTPLKCTENYPNRLSTHGGLTGRVG